MSLTEEDLQQVLENFDEYVEKQDRNVLFNSRAKAVKSFISEVLVPEAEKTQRENQIEKAYFDRNLAVLAFLRQIHYLNTFDPENCNWEYGYRIDEELDPAEWVVVWVEHPQFQQMAWHLPTSLIEDLEWLKHEQREWDGHTREEKNDRLLDMIYENPSNLKKQLKEVTN